MTTNEHFGIDVSYWQGDIDWSRVKKAGVKFAIIRACASANEDSCFQKNIKNAREQGIDTGVYVYTKAKNKEQIDKELSLLFRLISPHSLQLPVFWDMEDISLRTLSRQELTENMLYALSRISEMGYKAGVYSNPDWLSYVLDSQRLSNYPLWLACYTTKEQREKLWGGDVFIWQYGTGTVDGIKGSVDVNILYGENEEIKLTEVTVTNCLAAWIRKAPNKESGIITAAVKGRTLRTDNTAFTDSRGVEWLKVFVNDKAGYIGKRYVTGNSR